MGIDGGFFVKPAAVDGAAEAAAQVGDGVTLIGDAVAGVPTTPMADYGDWQLGDCSIDLVMPWRDLLHAAAQELQDFGYNLKEASLHYARTDGNSGASFDGILS